MKSDNNLSRIAAVWLLALAIVLAPLSIRDASAQSAREQARNHFVRGAQLYQQGNYIGAVGAFQAAERLVPHPLNQFNIGLSYEKMGSRRPALDHFKEYLRRLPGAANAAGVRAKINRLEGELRQTAARAAQARAAADAKRRADTDAKAAETARKAAADKKAEDAKRKAAAAKRPVPVPPRTHADPVRPPPEMLPVEPPVRSGPAPVGPVAPTAPALRTPQASTGDPQLDRVAAIDVVAIRDARGLQSIAAGAPAANGSAARGNGGATPTTMATDAGKAKKKRPLYKQWWFWVVVGVSTLILIDIASSDDSSTQRGAPVGSQSGAVLLRF